MHEQRKKACFVVPYFGTLPEYFDIFLRTCRQNEDFDWLIITNDDTSHPYPPNVHVQYTTFETFRNRVQTHFNFTIALPRAYKICDFRAAFGEIFTEELHEYRFWGHCDLDQYFGKINHFVTENVLNEYDKILCLGHFTLFRNTPYINGLYKKSDRGNGQNFEDAFSTEAHWIFDEWPTNGSTSSNRIFKQEGVKTWVCPQCFCDLQPFRSLFCRTLFNFETESWTDDMVKSEIYIWKNGLLWRCYLKGSRLKAEEILYVHVRQRKMLQVEYDATKTCFFIVPNRFVSADDFSDETLKHMLCAAGRRAILRPDETHRKYVIFCGLLKACYSKIKNIRGKKNG